MSTPIIPLKSSLDYQLAILNAQKEGFYGFAAALTVMYLREHPIRTTPAKEVAP